MDLDQWNISWLWTDGYWFLPVVLCCVFSLILWEGNSEGERKTDPRLDLGFWLFCYGLSYATLFFIWWIAVVILNPASSRLEKVNDLIKEAVIFGFIFVPSYWLLFESSFKNRRYFWASFFIVFPVVKMLGFVWPTMGLWWSYIFPLHLGALVVFRSRLRRSRSRQFISDHFKMRDCWNLRYLNFERQDLRGFDFNNKQCFRAKFNGSDLRGVNFEGADLECAQLRGCDLRNANFAHANLCHADFSGSLLDGVQLQSARLHKARFHGVDLSHVVSAYWAGARLSGAVGLKTEGLGKRFEYYRDSGNAKHRAYSYPWEIENAWFWAKPTVSEVSGWVVIKTLKWVAWGWRIIRSPAILCSKLMNYLKIGRQRV